MRRAISLSSPFVSLFAGLYVMVGTLLACGTQLHDRIISPREEAWVYKTSLTLPLFIEMPVPS